MIEKHRYDQLCADVLPLFRRIPQDGRYAITLGGSHGKGLSDRKSDFDFRVYYDHSVDSAGWQFILEELDRYIVKWKAMDVEIDGVWARDIASVNRELDIWTAGEATPTPYFWNVWGYQMLTDIYNQSIVEDPFGVAQGWKDRLSIYPEALRNSILSKHGDSLKYWRADYHYISKVRRKDYVFVAYITARLVHDMMQVIYALNRFYYPGDGLNMVFLDYFSVKPDAMQERVVSLLYPGNDPDCLDRQYREMVALIDEVLGLLQADEN